MFNLEPTPQYTQCRNKLVRLGYDMSLLDKTVKLLRSGKPLPAKYNDHALSGALSNYRECHDDGQNLIQTIIDRDGNERQVIIFNHPEEETTYNRAARWDDIIEGNKSGD